MSLHPERYNPIMEKQTGRFRVTMKQFWRILLFTLLTMTLTNVAYANVGPAILLRFSIHFFFLTWIIGLGESVLLCILFLEWRLCRVGRIIISMIAANFASALLGQLFVRSTYAARIMGDITIENLIPALWTMVYVTFVLTMIIEFPFFLLALYGRKRLVLKAVAATLFAHCISYTLLFNHYTPYDVISMATKLEVVPATVFEMEEDYDLYYISPDGKYVLRSGLTGSNKEVVTTLDMDGVPDRLCAYPKKVVEEIQEGKEGEDHKTVSRVCWESGFDLYVLMNVDEVYKTNLLIENFSPRSAVRLYDGAYKGEWDIPTKRDWGHFRTFENVKFPELFSSSSDNGTLSVDKDVLYTKMKKKDSTLLVKDWREAMFSIDTPFVQWLIRNGTHIAGDYGVFQLGKDQICILDPEKKRIALIARGFGPVVAKPPLEEIPKKSPEETNEQTVHEVP